MDMILKKDCKMEAPDMLLEFRFQNYKSFLDEATLSMTAAPKQKGLDYSLFIKKHKGKEIKALCSSVIYGSNAAGKTTVIGAMDTFRSIVMRGNIRNVEDSNSPNLASTKLEFIPNNTLAESKPVRFAIDFLIDKYRIQYNLALDLGTFLDSQYKRRVVEEKLFINDYLTFERIDYPDMKAVTLNVNANRDVLSMFSDAAKKDSASAEMIAIDGIDREELFLTNGFKLIFSQKLSKLVTDWFANQLIVIYCTDPAYLEHRFSEPKQNSSYVSDTINEAVKLFGVNANPLDYQARGRDEKAKLVSLVKSGTGNVKTLPAEAYESFGTLRFINLFPFVMRALETGATFVVDEFDSSIHPVVLLNIINLFHNDEVNTKHAQLIFNTHDTDFLNANMVRRDEIKFVDRDAKTHYSTLFTLSDFGTSGENAVRKSEDFRTRYLEGLYGGIAEADFSSLFEKRVPSGGEA